jgi:hypothetical protein
VFLAAVNAEFIVFREVEAIAEGEFNADAP